LLLLVALTTKARERGLLTGEIAVIGLSRASTIELVAR